MVFRHTNIETAICSGTPHKPLVWLPFQNAKELWVTPLAILQTVSPKARSKATQNIMRTFGCLWLETLGMWQSLLFLLMQLLAPLELCMVCALDGLIATLYRDLPVHGDCLLAWHSLGRTFRSDSPVAEQLAQKLMTLMSAKGEDVMLQVSGEVRVQQRCRKSIPAGLWAWREICGWRWPNASQDHINRLELRALYTALRWRVLRRKQTRVRFLHLTDSMVCLHLLRRGRSSSHKLQFLLYRVSSLILATGLHPFVTYVSTDSNPADRPSRQLGSLRANTVSPKTRQRYQSALQAFIFTASFARNASLMMPFPSILCLQNSWSICGKKVKGYPWPQTAFPDCRTCVRL